MSSRPRRPARGLLRVLVTLTAVLASCTTLAAQAADEEAQHEGAQAADDEAQDEGALAADEGPGGDGAPRLHPLSPDRPDVTESPYTVDAGHFQAEADFMTWSRDEGEDSYSLFVTNLKLGVSRFIDLQLVVEPYVSVPTPEGRNGGFGDLVGRVKFNLRGDQRSGLGVGVMPWVKAPISGSRGNDQVEGGLMVPFALALTEDHGVGWMLETDWLADADESGHHLHIISTATIAGQLIGPLGGFLEYVGDHSFEPDVGFALSANGGLTYALSYDVQLDAAVSFGLTDPATDYGALAGITARY